MQSPARPETEQDEVRLCDAGQVETLVIISTVNPRQERSAFMQLAAGVRSVMGPG